MTILCITGNRFIPPDPTSSLSTEAGYANQTGGCAIALAAGAICENPTALIIGTFTDLPSLARTLDTLTIDRWFWFHWRFWFYRGLRGDRRLRSTADWSDGHATGGRGTSEGAGHSTGNPFVSALHPVVEPAGARRWLCFRRVGVRIPAVILPITIGGWTG